MGLVRIRMWRPFPFEELREAVAGCKALGVIDRSLSTGGPGGPVASEVKSALYHLADKPKVVEFIMGLGGRDVRIEDIERVADKTIAVANGAEIPPFEIVGVRE